MFYPVHPYLFIPQPYMPRVVFSDPFVDDSEEVAEVTIELKKRRMKTAHSGFFVSTGELEVLKDVEYKGFRSNMVNKDKTENNSTENVGGVMVGNIEGKGFEKGKEKVKSKLSADKGTVESKVDIEKKKNILLSLIKKNIANGEKINYSPSITKISTVPSSLSSSLSAPGLLPSSSALSDASFASSALISKSKKDSSSGKNKMNIINNTDNMNNSNTEISNNININVNTNTNNITPTTVPTVPRVRVIKPKPLWDPTLDTLQAIVQFGESCKPLGIKIGKTGFIPSQV